MLVTDYVTIFIAVEEDDQIPSPQVNNISHVEPLQPLILGLKEPSNICHSDAMPKDLACHEDDFCECLHVLKVPLGDTVDIVLIDEGKK